MSFLDSGNDGCEWYALGTNYQTCGNYDTEDFKARVMCCACGGGDDFAVPYVIQCEDQDDGVADNGGDKCEWYGRSERN